MGMHDEVDRASPALGIVVGADGAARLEKHHVDVSTGFGEDPTFGDDAVLIGIHPGGKRRHEFPVDGDLTGFDQYFTRSA
jgi:hypothetical protein